MAVGSLTTFAGDVVSREMVWENASSTAEGAFITRLSATDGILTSRCRIPNDEFEATLPQTIR
jgi:hypothetical protein